MINVEPLESLNEWDPLARFILSKHHFAVATSRVKHAAFMPAPEDRGTSVFAIRGLDEEIVWQVGQEVVATPRGKTLYARADVFEGDVRALDLAVVLDNVPPRHANITRWPEDKSALKSRAQELASLAQLRIYHSFSS